jgi:hypothetical protein
VTFENKTKVQIAIVVLKKTRRFKKKNTLMCKVFNEKKRRRSEVKNKMKFKAPQTSESHMKMRAVCCFQVQKQ